MRKTIHMSKRLFRRKSSHVRRNSCPPYPHCRSWFGMWHMSNLLCLTRGTRICQIAFTFLLLVLGLGFVVVVIILCHIDCLTYYLYLHTYMHTCMLWPQAPQIIDGHNAACRRRPHQATCQRKPEAAKCGIKAFAATRNNFILKLKRRWRRWQ